MFSLSLSEEIILTQIIGDIISENNYRCMAYNICNDHVHMIIVCAQEELTTIVRKLKSLSRNYLIGMKKSRKK